MEKVAFVSTMEGYAWGGSEELWSRAALDLRTQGLAVSASVREWKPLHARMRLLSEKGVGLWLRPENYPILKLGWQRIAHRGVSSTALEVRRMLRATKPTLVIFSSGSPYPSIDLLELCMEKGIRFVTIGQANWDTNWIDDEHAARCRRGLSAAIRCYFVSKANLALTEKQLGCQLSNAEVVWNPFNIDYNSSPSWPALGSNGEVRLACAARLDPPSKGQDILFEALSAPQWVGRNWRLYLYGEGPMRNVLERLVQHFGLSERVVFAGHRPVEEIWASNHVLVMPSRAEGLPLAIVEAMLCARPVVATDVAGNSEVVEDGITGFLADAPTARSVRNAMERLWGNRAKIEAMGMAGAKKIRELVPPDPVGKFTDKIKCLLQ